MISCLAKEHCVICRSWDVRKEDGREKEREGRNEEGKMKAALLVCG